jgi:hypothetical protein
MQWVSGNVDTGASWQVAYEVQINMEFNSERLSYKLKDAQLTNATDVGRSPNHRQALFRGGRGGLFSPK